MKLEHIQANGPYYTNGFLVFTSKNTAIAIDPAASADKFEHFLQEHTGKLTHILLTHGHPDHIGSVEYLREKYGAKLYMSPADAQLFNIEYDKAIEDGQIIQVDELGFKVFSTPGHTPGSSCYLCQNLLFTGDTLFAGTIGRTDLEGANPADMVNSLKKLNAQIPSDTAILPGHGAFSTMQTEKQENPFLLQIRRKPD